MKQESTKHNTQKDQKFDKSKYDRRKGKKSDRDNNTDTTTKSNQGDGLVGGRSCLRESTENDPQWYAQDPQLLRDAFSLSMAERLGSKLKLELPLDASTSYPYTKSVSWVVPGVYNISVAPVPGISKDASSAVNVAAKKLFTYIRHANSGASNYQAPDLMMYLLAMDNCYALWNWLVRLYGIARVYSTRNAYLPNGLLKTMNVDVVDIQTNLNSLRTLINQFGAKLSTMKVPSHLSYFKRHAWLFSNVFADSTSSKAQCYLYNPSILYKWVDKITTSGQLPYLEPVAITDQSLKTEWKLDGLRALVNEFINPIFYSSEDFDIMSGDILKAYGADNCYTVPSIQEDYAVLPVQNLEVAMQFENAKIPGGTVQPTEISWRITQSNEEAIVFNPAVPVNRADCQESTIYNFHTDEVSPEMIAVATRLNLLPNVTDAQFQSGVDVGTASLVSCGSEIVTQAYSLEFQSIDTSTGTYNWRKLPMHSNFIFTPTHESPFALAMCAATQFDWCPLMLVYKTAKTGEDTGFFQGIVGDLDNYTTISTAVLANMNDVALLSMFGIPGSAGV